MKQTQILWLIVAMFLATACTTTSGGFTLTPPDQLLKSIEEGKVKVAFHGTGTEPFWNVYITEKELLYVNNGIEEMENFYLNTPFQKDLPTQVLSYTSQKGEKFTVTILKAKGSDGMSPRDYSYTVIWDPENSQLDGGGEAGLINFDDDVWADE